MQASCPPQGTHPEQMKNLPHPHSIELITTGTELLLGQTINTHLRTIAQALLQLGLRIQRQTTIPDGEILLPVLQEALSRSRILIVTGGLGPTSDDVTRPLLSKLLEKPLILHEPTLQHIRQRFRNRNIPVTPLVEKQAYLPQGAEVFPNPNGTAPGLYVTKEFFGQDKHLFFLPGPPRELIPILNNHVLPRIDALCPDRPSSALLLVRTLGKGESFLQQVIEQPLREISPNIEIGYCARSGEVDLRIILYGEETAKLDLVRETLLRLIGDVVWHMGNEELEHLIIARATQLRTTVATAESCTGGLVAHRLTRVPGASAIYLGGVVVYSNAEKIRQLDVPEHLLQNHGAVSSEVALAMLQGLLKKTQAQHAVATTGIAGPTGGTPQKPVGTCFIAATSPQGPIVQQLQLSQERDAFQYQATQHALNLLRLSLG